MGSPAPSGPCQHGCKYLPLHGSSNRHFSTVMSFMLPRPDTAWSMPAFCSLGQCLRGSYCSLAIGTPQPPYSWAYLYDHQQFFLIVELKSFLLHIQQVMFCPLPESMGNNCFLFFIIKSLHSHSRQEVKQFKCLQISFLFSLCPKQTGSRCRVTKKQTDFLFVEGCIQLDCIFFSFSDCSMVTCGLECFDMLLAKRLPSCDNLSFVHLVISLFWTKQHIHVLVKHIFTWSCDGNLWLTGKSCTAVLKSSFTMAISLVLGKLIKAAFLSSLQPIHIH